MDKGRTPFRHTQANILSGVRRDFVDGVEYVVAPVVLCKATVLNGELMTADALGRSIVMDFDPESGPESLTNLWEELPVTIGHPPDINLDWSVTKTLAWLDEQAIGQVRSVRMSGDKLVGDMWLVANQVDHNASRVLETISNGKDPMEVSIGSFSMVVPNDGELSGKQFAGEFVDLAANHLAILPDDVGACSCKSGCGVPRMGQKAATLTSARRPAFAGSSGTAWGSVDKTLSAFIRAGNKALGMDTSETTPVSELSHQMKDWIAGHTLLGRADAITRRDLLFFPVVEPTSGMINRTALLAVLGGRAAQAAASDETKLSARKMASGLLEEVFQVAGQTEAKSKAGHKTCGKRFGAFIREGIKGADLETDEFTARVARLSEDLPDTPTLSTARVSEFIDGGGAELIPDPVVFVFASALNLSPGLLFAATSEDASAFARSLDDPSDSQVSPAFFARMKEVVGHAVQAGLKKLNITGGNMDKATLITKIAEARKLDDKATAALDALPEALLAAMVPADAKPTATPTAAAASTPTEDPAKTPKTDPVTDAPTAQPMDWATIMASAPPEVKAQLDRLSANETDERAAYVTALDGKVGLTNEQLKAIDFVTLKAMAAHQQTTAQRVASSFLGASGAVVPAVTPDEEEARRETLSLSPSVFAAQVTEGAVDPFSGRAQLGL